MAKLVKLLLLFSFTITSFLSGNFASVVFENKIPGSDDFSRSAPPDTLVKMERTICYGTCPAYELFIFNNGDVEFNGKEFVGHEGAAEGEISKENIERIQTLIRESKVMKIPSNPNCESRMTDHPSVFLTLKTDGKRHSITHYHGCKGFKYEDDLYKVEEAIDSLAGVNKWIEGE